MSIGETPITLVGNLTSDPDLRFTPNGVGVASFTVASTPRRFDKETGKYVDGDTLFLRCSAWRDLGDHVAESLTKGARVIVSGRLRQRSFETQEGEQRTVFEVDVDEMGPSLRFATAKVTKTSRTGGPPAPHPADLDNSWTGAPSVPAGTGASEEPPF